MAHTPLHRFGRGLRHVGLGAGFLARRPRLIPHLIGPVVLAVLMVVGAWYASWGWTPWLLSLFWARPAAPGLLQNLWNGVALFAVLWAFATMAILLYGALGVVGAPFYDRLSMAVEREVRPGSLDDFGWREELSAVGYSSLHSLAAIGVWLAFLACLLPLNLIPGVGSLLELVLSTVGTWAFAAREAMDGPMSRRGMGFADKLRLLWTHRAEVLGFGMGASLVVFLPFVNFLAIPVVVVGGTLLFLELEASQLQPVARAFE